MAKLYRVDLRQATNILGTKWDDVATSHSVEALNEMQLADEGVDVLPKDLVIDLIPPVSAGSAQRDPENMISRLRDIQGRSPLPG